MINGLDSRRGSPAAIREPGWPHCSRSPPSRRCCPTSSTTCRRCWCCYFACRGNWAGCGAGCPDRGQHRTQPDLHRIVVEPVVAQPSPSIWRAHQRQFSALGLLTVPVSLVAAVIALWAGLAVVGVSRPRRTDAKCPKSRRVAGILRLLAPGTYGANADAGGRCRRAPPAATEALSDSAGPAIGIDTTASQFWRTSRDRPLPSEPTTTTTGPEPSNSSRVTSPSASRSDDLQPASAHCASVRLSWWPGRRAPGRRTGTGAPRDHAVTEAERRCG